MLVLPSTGFPYLLTQKIIIWRILCKTVSMYDNSNLSTLFKSYFNKSLRIASDETFSGT